MTKEEFIKKWDTDSDYANGSKEMKKDLALLEQRLLLSSEAEKGEKEFDWTKDCEFIAPFQIQGCRGESCYIEDASGKLVLKTETDDFALPVEAALNKYFASPPSPQEKQGVEECKNCIDGKVWATPPTHLIECPVCSPAAPDKGEETQL